MKENTFINNEHHFGSLQLVTVCSELHEARHGVQSPCWNRKADRLQVITSQLERTRACRYVCEDQGSP